jgi:hypothetical protein
VRLQPGCPLPQAAGVAPDTPMLVHGMHSQPHHHKHQPHELDLSGSQGGFARASDLLVLSGDSLADGCASVGSPEAQVAGTPVSGGCDLAPVSLASSPWRASSMMVPPSHASQHTRGATSAAADDRLDTAFNTGEAAWKGADGVATVPTTAKNLCSWQQVPQWGQDDARFLMMGGVQQGPGFGSLVNSAATTAQTAHPSYSLSASASPPLCAQRVTQTGSLTGWHAAACLAVAHVPLLTVTVLPDAVLPEQCFWLLPSPAMHAAPGTSPAHQCWTIWRLKHGTAQSSFNRGQGPLTTTSKLHRWFRHPP